ncbi:hypothetical protein SAMN05421688_2387 [Poseidonocella pacifica]|uniref:Uncharacterized protein n=1 Tax=Poseidonocella pacifica TaxID=871651 RepID=A0A1I0XK44_9RHOB|nr:hypothetical protein [Poseidonocella pacifica]SFB01489.1 hypothetical protein SAMN05421688_2387 [Poseidonocella pacifica]
MNPFWLLRMSKWARRPPSRRRVMLVLAIAAVGIGIALVENYLGWPDWATLEPRGRSGLPR